jgi:hypothetical protein
VSYPGPCCLFPDERQVSLGALFSRTFTLNDMPTGQTEDVELDQMMDHLVTVSGNINPPMAILVEMAAERWENRPVSDVAMGRDRRNVGLR